jgi:hypothetical protein
VVRWRILPSRSKSRPRSSVQLHDARSGVVLSDGTNCPAWPRPASAPGCRRRSPYLRHGSAGLFVTIRDRFFAGSQSSTLAACRGHRRIRISPRQSRRAARGHRRWAGRGGGRPGYGASQPACKSKVASWQIFRTVPGRPNVAFGQGPARSRLSRKAQAAHTRVCCAYQRMRAACQTRRNEEDSWRFESNCYRERSR